MTFSPIRLVLNILLVLSSSFVFAGSATADCMPQQVLRDDVLIVVNDNSLSSPIVGDYYCEKRGIDPVNVAHVRVPVTNDVEFDQFISLRDQLIKHMQKETLPTGEAPVVCDTSQGYTRFYCPESVDQLSQKSKIRYIVMTKGLPIRFNFPTSTLAGSPHRPSVDNYLRFWLSNYFSEDVAFEVNFNDRAVDFGDGRGMREIDPVIDRELIVGRIDGVDIESAKRLVDRTINAEKSGIFGKLYGNKFGGSLIRKSGPEGAFWKAWRIPTLDNTNNETTVYPTWRYLHGLFGDLLGIDIPAVRHTTNPECASHDADGRIPKQCVVAVNRGSNANLDDNTIIREDLPPGDPDGRIPSPDNALVHQGFHDSFSAVNSFDHLLRWSKNSSCNKLCADAGNVEDCKAASTDAYKEIDTSCVRVAEGYMGYTFTSYPVGMMASWPTGWFQSTNFDPQSFDKTGGQPYLFWQPEVREDVGFDDDFSLWYRNIDDTPSALCYAGQENSSEENYQSPDGHCTLDKKISINQTIGILERQIDLDNPQTIRIQFKYRGIGLNKNVPITVGLTIRESVYSDGNIEIGETNQTLYGFTPAPPLIAPNDPVDVSKWKDATVTFTLDPAKHQHPDNLFDGIRISINAATAFDGELAFDDFLLDVDGEDIALLNSSFNDGHRQLSGGDSAATFLSRLNGVAFWGNISHHEFNGHSFERNPYEILIYFLRGLPLGDAVWFAEFHNSGIFYGDPIYSPIAVHLDYLSATDNRAPDDHFNIVADSPLALTGDTLNGSGVDVTSTYSIDYCRGNDFFPCDENGSWQSITNMQNRSGGQRSLPDSPAIPLGDWDISGLAEGEYVLRLAVTSTNSTKGLTQTFYDYYNVTMYSPLTADDFDSDGLSYQEEIAAGTNPWSDDTDNDGLPDLWEVSNGVDALNYSIDADSDGDGVSDSVEFIRDTDPSNDQDVPVIRNLEVDSDNGIDDGQSPFETVGAAVNAAEGGDTILLLPGEHVEVNIIFSAPLHLKAKSEKNTIFKPNSLRNNAIAGTVSISDLAIDSTNISIISNTDNGRWLFERNDIKANITIKTGLSNSAPAAEFVNNVFTGASDDAIHVSDFTSAVLRNNTLTGNEVGVRVEAGGRVLITNSIITGNNSADLIGVSPESVSFSLTGDVSLTGIRGNISGDPQFVDSQNADYHLKPESPAIDVGDPQSDFSLEPASSTGRINLGLYGNTSEATVAAAGSGGTQKPEQGGSSGRIDSLLLLWFSLFGLWRIYNKHQFRN